MVKRVVITGLGPVTPIGIGKEKFWNSLVNGRSNYSEITRFPLHSWDKVRIAAQIKGFDPREYVNGEIVDAISRLNARNGGLSIYYGVAGAKLAVEDSGLELKLLDKDRAGVVLGSGSGDLGLLQRADTDFTHGTFSLANALPGIVAKQLGFHGPTYAASSACATGNLALRLGYNEISSGNNDLMIVGSSEAPIDVPHYFGSDRHRKEGVKGLSQKNDMVNGMMPFDIGRDGIVLSEGAGVLVLEELKHAQKRKSHIYCEVLGFGEHTDFDTNMVRITRRGYASAMHLALDSAGLGKRNMRRKSLYVNAHGTATPLNDLNESYAIEEVFGANVPVSSFKGTTGHAQAASPGIELVGSALVLDRGIIPLTNLRSPAKDCAALNYVRASRELPLDLVVKNSAGFNGVYSTAVLGKYVV